jgi:hypothetical protein
MCWVLVNGPLYMRWTLWPVAGLLVRLGYCTISIYYVFGATDRDTFGEFGISVLTFDCRDQRKHAVNLPSTYICIGIRIRYSSEYIS